MTASGAIVPFPQRRGADGDPWEAWVDEAAAARYFTASPRTIRRWRSQGMPSRMLGGLRRYRLSECEAWLRARERSAS